MADETIVQPSPLASQPGPEGVSFLTTTLIATAVAMFAAVISVWYLQTHSVLGGSGVVQKFVFVDGNAIFKAQVKAFSQRPDAGTPEAAEKAAKEFSTKMSAAIAPYKDAGYVVLNSAVAMNIPTEFDITPQIAKQVGVVIP